MIKSQITNIIKWKNTQQKQRHKKASIYSLHKTLFTKQQIQMNAHGAELTADKLKTRQAVINLDTLVLSAMW